MNSYGVGDLVQVESFKDNPEVMKRVSKVEEVNGNYLTVRPKYFRESFQVPYESVSLVEKFVEKVPGKRGRKPRKTAEEALKEDTQLDTEQKKFVSEQVEVLETKIPAELEQLWQLCNRIHKKLECNHGVTTMYYHMIQEIKRHTDKKTVSRG